VDCFGSAVGVVPSLRGSIWRAVEAASMHELTARTGPEGSGRRRAVLLGGSMPAAPLLHLCTRIESYPMTVVDGMKQPQRPRPGLEACSLA
jgi:hypothetical protein